MRHRRDIDDALDDRVFDREEAESRRRVRDESLVSAAEQERGHQQRDAALKARVVEFTRQANERAIMAEYAHAGVEPRPGTLVSLTLLLSLGWRVEEDGRGVRTLVQPPVPEKYVARGECS